MATHPFISAKNPLESYAVSDIDDGQDPAYYGFAEATGLWVIVKITDSTGQVRYERGSEAY